MIRFFHDGMKATVGVGNYHGTKQGCILAANHFTLFLSPSYEDEKGN